MNLVVGVVLSAATVFLFAWGFAQHRRPVPARWTQFPGASSAFTIFLVGLFPGAVGALGMAAVEPTATLASLNVWGVVAAVAAVVLTVVMTPKFIRAGRMKVAEVVDFPIRPEGAPTKPAGRPARKAA